MYRVKNNTKNRNLYERIAMLKNYGCLGFKVLKEEQHPHFFRVTITDRKGMKISRIGRNREDAYSGIFKTIKRLKHL